METIAMPESPQKAPRDSAAQTEARPRETESAGQRSKPASWRRFAPLAALLAAGVAAFVLVGDQLSFETLRDNREALIAWRDGNIWLAAATFVAAYAAVVALSIPGAIWMTLLGGFLFGVSLGAPLIVLAATLGATLVFLVARSSLGAALKERAGPWLGKLEAGFRENAASYLLILRLVPAAPFFIVNLAPAFLGVPLSTFIWTTVLGIVPGTVVFTSVGAGLGEIIDQGGRPDLGLIFEPHVLGPLLGLAALSALPILVKALRKGPNAE